MSASPLFGLVGFLFAVALPAFVGILYALFRQAITGRVGPGPYGSADYQPEHARDAAFVLSTLAAIAFIAIWPLVVISGGAPHTDADTDTNADTDTDPVVEQVRHDG
ncbi:MAG: hypothetical protein CMD39_07385 [Gammaproteobacteria bacterium]|nr:hypothetical protein [Gammaproteobacteria bacterium]